LTFTNKDLTARVLLTSFTVTIAGRYSFQIFFDSVSGSGAYEVNARRQRSGAGTDYPLVPRTSFTAEAGDTSFGFPSIEVDCRVGDLISFYGKGQAGDGSRSGVVDVFMNDTVRSTTPANALDVSTTGEAGLDFNNVKAAAAPTTLTNITVPTVTTSGLSADAIDDIWDEVLTLATHNVGYSAGQRLRFMILDGATAQAGAANSITLAAAASATDDIYVQNIVSIVSGVGAGQTRLIVEYDGGTKIAIVDREWEVIPNNTSIYELLPFSGILLTQHGVALAGTANTIQLSANASITNDIYIGSMIVLSTGLGAGQARLITAYNGGTQIATVAPDWVIVPDATTVYKIIPVGRAIIDSISAAVLAQIVDGTWDELLAGHAIVGSAGASLSAAGSAADPLLNPVPGAYASGTAGFALGRVGSGQITTVSPVAQDGDVEIYQGDDYDNADGRAIDWTNLLGTWPDLTGATITVAIKGVGSFTGSVVTPTGAGQKVRLELTRAQTLTIPADQHSFEVRATQSVALGSDVITLVEGTWTCIKRY